MKLKIVTLMMGLFCLIILGLTSCGGGGSNGADKNQELSSAYHISGFAEGSRLTGTVYLKDSSNPAKELSLSTPSEWPDYSFDVANLTPPFFIKAVGTSGGKNYSLYSYADVKNGIFNVNSLTNLAIVLANGGNDPADIYSNPASAKAKAMLNNLPAAIVSIKSKLAPLFEAYDNNDFVSYSPVFRTSNRSHVGLDVLFDAISTDINNGKVNISNKNTGSQIISSALTGYSMSGNVNFGNIPPVPIDDGVINGTKFTITGKVVDSSGKGIPRALLTVYGQRGSFSISGYAMTDASGSYSFSAHNGSYSLNLSDGRYTFNTASQLVTVNGANVAVPNFVGTGAYEISVRIETADGASVSGVNVTAVSSSGLSYPVTSMYSTYSFYTMPNGTYTITPTKSGYSFTPRTSTVIVNNANTRIAFVAASNLPADGGGGGGNYNGTGLPIAEANSFAPVCMDKLNKANSYGIPNQMPAYYAAACTQNFMAKMSPTAAAATGLGTFEEAIEGLKQYSEACSENKKVALSLYSPPSAAIGAPSGYNELVNEMYEQLIGNRIVVNSSIGPIKLDCVPANK